jgi:hypothetical protein
MHAAALPFLQLHCNAVGMQADVCLGGVSGMQAEVCVFQAVFQACKRRFVCSSRVWGR